MQRESERPRERSAVRRNRPRTLPRASKRDLFLLAYLPVMTVLAWCLPERSWLPTCRAIARVAARVGKKRRADAARVAQVVGRRSVDPLGAAAGMAVNAHLSSLQLLRCHRIGSWRPPIALVGDEHLRAALAAGKGAILWLAPFVFSGIVGRMAIHRAGFSVAHLSRTGHGLSASRLGELLFNPIVTSVELRFVERLVMRGERTAGALREMVRRVRGNGIVSISLHNIGNSVHTVPFLEGTMTVADGAPALARRSGAALLPVFAVHSDEGFVVTIEPPLTAPEELAPDAAVERLIVDCARRIESYALRWPEQYVGWYYIARRVRP
jgi:lauroyl/myristoyl acyltransferase